MKPITKYICEICNTEYVTQEEALKCEKHHKPIKEVRYTYSTYYRNWNEEEPTKEKPTGVTLIFEDGDEAVYSL